MVFAHGHFKKKRLLKNRKKFPSEFLYLKNMKTYAAGDIKSTFHKRGWLMERGDQKKATHLLMNNGRLCVPDHEHKIFLQQLAVELVRQPRQKPSIVEIRTHTFKMMMDLDIECSKNTCLKDLFPLFCLLQEASFHFWECLDSEGERVFPRVCVCTAPEKIKEQGKKIGVHLIWPDVYATANIVRAFRLVVLPVLDAKLSGIKENVSQPWDKVIDSRVYEANGLRLVFNSKGKNEHRPYVPSFMLRQRKTEPDTDPEAIPEVGKEVSQYQKWLELLSIRTPFADPTPLFCKVSQLPPKVQSILKVPMGTDGRDYAPNATSCHRGRLEVYKDVLPAIMAAIPQEYGPHSITSVARFPHFVVFRSTSKFCRNLGRHHNSVNVYFSLSHDGLAQRCYCRCDTLEDRLYSRCEDFQSEFFRLDERIIIETLRISQCEQMTTVDSFAENKLNSGGVVQMPSQKKKKSFDNILKCSSVSRGSKKPKKKHP